MRTVVAVVLCALFSTTYENIGELIDEQGERFDQEISKIEKSFEGKSQGGMLANYYWSLKRETDDLSNKRKRSSLNDTDLVYAFVNCSLRAAAVGIEGLIPPHNPLKFQDVNITQKMAGGEYHFEVTDNMLYSLMDLELKQVDVTTYTNPGALNIDYNIYWPVLNFTGNFAWSAEIFGTSLGGNGTYNIILEHTDFTGLFNLTKPGQEAQGIKEHLDDFTLQVAVKEVEVTISGAGPEWLTDTLLESALKYMLNHVPAEVGDFLKEKRFNEFWIGHPEKIDAILQWCKANPV